MTRTFATLIILATILSSTGCVLVGLGVVADRSALRERDSIIPQPDIVTKAADPDEVVDAAWRKFCEVRSYRTRGTMTLQNGSSIVTTAEFVAPDRRRAVQFAGTDAEFETITIGSRTYMRSKGQWEEMKGPLANVYGDPLMMCPQGKKAPEIPHMPSLPKPKLTLIGPGEVNGVKVMVYSSTLEFKVHGTVQRTSSTISIGVRDGRLYQTASKSGNAEDEITTTMDFMDYDADISIEPPI